MNDYAPLSFKEINDIAGHYAPSMIKNYNNKAFRFWVRSLTQRCASKIKTTLPDNWEGARRDFLLYCLLIPGFVFVSEHEKLGYWFQPGNLSGIDFYYQPVHFQLANPRASEYFTNTQFELHKDGEILKFLPDYHGFADVISYYAEKLATLDCSINTAIINSKFAFILAGKNKATVEALKKVLDKINKGEPAVFLDKALMSNPKTDGEDPWQYIELQKLKENYVLDQLLVDFQTILNSFDAEIGINTVPYQKKERLVSAEANSKMNDSQARIITAIECLKSCVKDIKKLYPDITLDFNLREEENLDVNDEPNPDRDV